MEFFYWLFLTMIGDSELKEVDLPFQIDDKWQIIKEKEKDNEKRTS